MPAPKNIFKARLKSGETQIGLWMDIGSATAAEICSVAGFDWLVIDGEHSPIGLRDIQDQLRAIGDKGQAVVRVRDDNRAEIKQMLDIGAQTILIPMIDSVEQAREAVKSILYPPKGVRGVGAALARASLYNSIPDYLITANDEVCLILQIESMAGIAALEDILALDGIDGIFIGPADLSADMGYLGNPEAKEVQTVINKAISTIQSAGKAAGILTFDPAMAETYKAMGVDFLAVGSDVSILAKGLANLARSLK
ncbi:HpcH/HpaI aldolase family protein [Cohaesibacter celericrescens]|uniref:2-keto-3-deoxy-L-rhamnonate aldolase n=1 Tax=Cohaesibacter celericrescens TaxID=2067669 RepID=A0A2N5XTZ5_9HYPH|nr:2-keto-3-deoxy-L-rhamnonate aldolase [Cohaesibacter celericrescens]